MHTLIVFLIVLVISTPIFLLLIRDFRRRQMIHTYLKRQLDPLKSELKSHEHNPAKQFELLDPIYRAVVFQTHSKLKMKRARLEEMVSDELNRLLKSRRSALWSSIVVIGRGVLALIMLSVSTASGYIVYTELETSDLFGPKQVESQTATILGDTFELPGQIASPEELGMALAYHMSQFDESFAIRYIGKNNDFEQMMEQAGDWIETNHIYVYRLSRQWETQFTDYGGYVDIEFDIAYDMTTEQAHQIEEKIDQVVEEIPTGLNDYEKVKYVNDFVVLNTAYNLYSVASPFTPYSILFNGEGVCEGYALTTLLLLEAAGVEARYISGEAGTELHAWNLVKLDGAWYHLDTTWNDPVPNRPGEVGYNYFLVSDETLRADHTWEEETYPVTATANYH